MGADTCQDFPRRATATPFPKQPGRGKAGAAFRGQAPASASIPCPGRYSARAEETISGEDEIPRGTPDVAKVEVVLSAGRESSSDEWLRRLAGYLSGDEAQSVLCVVPTEDAVAHLQERLIADFRVPGILGRPVRTFYRLAREIAEHRRLGGHDFSDLERSLLLQHIAATSEVPTLAPVQRFPGFASALGELIGELKLAMIHPSALRQAMERLPRSESNLRARLRDILILYERYQTLLEDERLHDAEGLMWHAVSALEQEPETLAPVSVIFFHGFRNYHRVQLRLLQIIANWARETYLHLRHDPTRPEGYAASERTVQMLRDLLGCEPRIERPPHDDTDIGHLAANLFRPDAPAKASDGSVIILESGSPMLEADQVAREIQRLVSDGRACHSEIAVIVRGSEAKQRFTHLLARHDVPPSTRTEALGASAAGRALLACLRIIRDGWLASAVSEVLRSPCLAG